MVLSRRGFLWAISSVLAAIFAGFRLRREDMRVHFAVLSHDFRNRTFTLTYETTETAESFVRHSEIRTEMEVLEAEKRFITKSGHVAEDFRALIDDAWLSEGIMIGLHSTCLPPV